MGGKGVQMLFWGTLIPKGTLIFCVSRNFFGSFGGGNVTYCKITMSFSFSFFFFFTQVKSIRSNFFQRRSVTSSLKKPLMRAEKKAVDEAFKRSAKRGPVTWVSLALVALAGGGLVLYVRHLKEEKEKGNMNKLFMDEG